MVPRLLFAAGAACLLLAGLASPTQLATAQMGSTPIQPRTTPAATTLAVIKAIGVGDTPLSVAVDSDDDTIYVANQASDTMTVINGRTAAVTSTVGVGESPSGVAVNQDDDTVYVTNLDESTVSVITGRTVTEDDTIDVGGRPFGVAVDQDDDTVYVTKPDSNSVSVINGRTATEDDTIGVGSRPRGVALDQIDDTVYVTNLLSNSVSVISGRTATVVGPAISLGANAANVAVNQDDDTVYVTRLVSPSGSVSVIDGRSAATVGSPIAAGPLTPYGVAVDQLDDTVYVTNEDDSALLIISGRTATVFNTLVVAGRPFGLAVDDTGVNQGLVYVSTLDDNALSVVGRVAPSLGTPSGTAGSVVQIDVDVPQVTYDVDDATIESVSFGGTSVTPTPLAGNSWQVTAPAGTPGTTVAVPVTVTFRGGLTASAGTFTLTTPAPAPPPVFPPSAPQNVVATAGDGQATLTWSAPVSSGTFPITNYEVRSTPAGGRCLVNALTCTITGLANGTAYTLETRALNGAGWGPWSTPSNAVTPAAPPPPPLITITGNRGSGNERGTIYVTGTSTALTETQVRAHVRLRGQTEYQPGRLVDLSADGRFAWQRATGKKTYVYFTGGGVQSNRVIIPAARS